MAKKLLVKQIKSTIGKKPNQKAVLWALGLRKINAEHLHDDNPVIRGMLAKVSHMVTVTEITK